MSLRSFSWVRLFLTVLICAACEPCSGETNTANPLENSGPETVVTSASVIESVRVAIERAGAYEARLVTRADSAAVFPGRDVPSFSVATHADLKVRPPSQVIASLRVVPEDPAMAPRDDPPMVILFDGQTIWTGATRLDQARFARSPRPLDSRYQIRGAGLLANKDLVETVRTFLDDYTFAPNATTHETDDGVVTRLVGEITISQMIDRVMSDPDLVAGLAVALDASQAMVIDMTAASMATMLHLELSIDSATSLPRSWMFGHEGAAIFTRVERFDTEVVFDDTVFAVPEDQREGAVDQTEAYLNQLGRSPTPSAERTEEVRVALRDATQRLIAQGNEAQDPAQHRP